MFLMRFSRNDVVLLPIPFTDLNQMKAATAIFTLCLALCPILVAATEGSEEVWCSVTLYECSSDLGMKPSVDEIKKGTLIVQKGMAVRRNTASQGKTRFGQNVMELSLDLQDKGDKIAVNATLDVSGGNIREAVTTKMLMKLGETVWAGGSQSQINGKKVSRYFLLELLPHPPAA